MMNSNMAADCIVINWLIMQHKSQKLIVFILFVYVIFLVLYAAVPHQIEQT
jgi:hypothetical protein